MAGTVLLTGANGSLALGFVQSFLAQYPNHTLIATVRNASPEQDPNTAKLLQLISKYPKAKVYLKVLDLGKLSDVRSFAEKMAVKISSGDLPRISAIVCNAATLSLESGQKFTSDGYDACFQVCHLAHYLLVLKLLGSMDSTAGRVVMLGSITHYPDKPNPLSSLTPCFFENIDELVKPERDPPALVHDRGFQRYGTAKLANVTFVEDLNKRLEADPKLSKITATAMDPGGLPSSRAQAVMKRSTQRIMATMNFLMPVLKYVTTAFRTTDDAGRDLVTVTVGPEFKGKRGYYVGLNLGTPAELSQDAKAQERLWNGCWRWARLTPGETALQNSAPKL